jgi:hypothetical protein
MQPSENFWRGLFFFAALYTLSAAPMLVVSYAWFPSLVFTREGLPFTHNPVFDTFWYTLALAVVLFGVGYFAASRDLTRSRVMVWLGLVAKLGLAILVFRLYAAGFLTPLFPVGVAGDVVWAVLFFEFLRRTRGAVAVSNLVG